MSTVAVTPWHSRISALLPLRVAPSNLVLFVLVTLAILFIRYYRRNPRRCYTLVALAIIPIMVFSPLLQEGQVIRFMDDQAQAAEALALATPELLQAMGLDTAPVRDVSTAKAAPTENPTSGTVGRDAPREITPVSVSRIASTRLQGSVTASDLPRRCGEGEPGVDTDGDGLEDRT